MTNSYNFRVMLHVKLNAVRLYVALKAQIDYLSLTKSVLIH